MPWVEQVRLTNWGEAGCIALGAYLLGCFATGYYLVRYRTGQDIRNQGSGNVGARNVGRVLGWSGFLLTMAGDFAKGAAAVWLARHWCADERLVLVAMLAVVAGHLWPIQLRLRGGKGVATSLGALLVYDVRLAEAFPLLFVAAFALARRSVLPALFAFACLPVLSACAGHDHAQVAGLSVLAGLIWLAHRKNIYEELALLADRRHLSAKHHPRELS